MGQHGSVPPQQQQQSSYFNLFFLDVPHLLVDSPVRACCFAPVLGRSFQFLAIGAATMIVYQIKSSKILSRSSLSYPPSFNNPYCAIWRLAWNITGTQLVGSTTHGNVFVWQLNSSAMTWQIVKTACGANKHFSDTAVERPLSQQT